MVVPVRLFVGSALQDLALADVKLFCHKNMRDSAIETHENCAIPKIFVPALHFCLKIMQKNANFGTSVQCSRTWCTRAACHPCTMIGSTALRLNALCRKVHSAGQLNALHCPCFVCAPYRVCRTSPTTYPAAHVQFITGVSQM